MRLLFFGLLFALSGVSFGQQIGKISGVAQMSPGEVFVAGAKITLLKQGAAMARVATDDLGTYEFPNIPFGSYQIMFTLPLTDTIRFAIQLNQVSLVQNFTIRATQEVREIRVIGNLVNGQNVPVAVTKIDTKKITEELASRDLPMLLNGTPGVYATNQGGGDGDARINVRGFDQRNVGVMIDGVPVNDMENGAVYWSNWFGLDAITSQMQIQRGLGATKIAMPSIGGTINIITQGVGTKKGGSFKQEYATGNFLRSSLSYNTGMTESGWGLTFSASYKQGQGWVDGTPTQGFFGYTKISKRLDKHLLTLSAFAAPQQHGQRSFFQGIQYWDANRSQALGVQFDSTLLLNDMGIRYNQHWGYVTNDAGEREILNERRNFYNKPQITLKDFWSVNDKLDISNLAYLSVGRGGGTSIFNSSAILRDSNFNIDWDQMITENQVNSLFGTPNIDPLYSDTEIKASQILLASINNHFWLGYLGQFNYQYSKKTSFSGGIDYRYYEGRHYQIITNLLGADYFLSAANFNDPDPMQRVGDKIAKNTFNADRDGVVTYAGVFGQVEHNGERINWFANVSTILNGYKGIDYFQRKVLELSDTTLRIGALDTIQYNGQTYHAGSPGLNFFETDWKYIPGVTVKGGLSYKLNKYQDVYCNLGYLNRTPQFSNVIDNNSNSFFGEIVNEIIYAAEGGYHYSNKHFGVNYNAYFTNWKNKPFPYGVAVPDPNDPTEFIRVNINGMDAIHMGQEIDVAWEISPKLSIDFMFSIGNWIWNSSKTVFIPQYDSLEFTFDAKGVHVGDAAQTAMAASLRYEPIKNAYIKVQGQIFDRYYANFDPFSLQGSNGGRDSWQIPSYSLINIFAGYRYKQFSLGGAITNLLNTSFISDATNNANGIYDQFDARSASVMFGQGLRFNINLAIQF
ncbi:MAG: TonB-dependent receptor plug domain-containing protein [Cryomorphaceae bacterium]|jgi:iron complex outermembrane receptor protein|nr:TonB-dependent receptor plug domain-containing protein [Cryomorphaceae bacterium]